MKRLIAILLLPFITVSRAGVWVSGVVFGVTGMMFIQDLLGMEKYLELAREHWVHMSPLWWIPVLAVCLWFGALAVLTERN